MFKFIFNFHSVDDLQNAIDYYDSISENLSLNFKYEIKIGFNTIKANPFHFKKLEMKCVLC